MKSFKKFLLEQLQKTLILEMPHFQIQSRFIDLEFELRLPQYNFDNIVEYLKTWLSGTVYLPKVKEPWIVNKTTGLKTDLLDYFKDETKITVPGNNISYLYDVSSDTLWQQTSAGNKEIHPFYISSIEQQELFVDSISKNNHILAIVTALNHTREELISKLSEFVKTNPQG